MCSKIFEMSKKKVTHFTFNLDFFLNISTILYTNVYFFYISRKQTQKIFNFTKQTSCEFPFTS